MDLIHCNLKSGELIRLFLKLQNFGSRFHRKFYECSAEITGKFTRPSRSAQHAINYWQLSAHLKPCRTHFLNSGFTNPRIIEQVDQTGQSATDANQN